ncbi:polyhomeotic-like protein 3 isoform X1 [Gouania willdenowi]|uniref:polyhomeotic-like protein 3 isoform X1 n=1 Tax=Gouania willdenowi TaxID=441366 RepID=UPI0010565982|nr:mucin-5AC-like isoform X1 [Gouania willdenowi]
MDQESLCPSQSEERETANKPCPQTPLISATPPRLTPHPSLLDPHTLTPSTSTSPPPLTPAPKLTSTTGPSPPKHTSTTGPTPPKLTSIIGPTSYKLTSSTGPTTPKLTSITGPTSSKLISTTGPTTPKLASITGPTSSKLISITGPTSSKLTFNTGPTTPKLLSTSGPTPKLTSTTGPTTPNLTANTGPTTPKLTSTCGPTPPKLTSTTGPTTTPKPTTITGPTISKLTSTSGPATSKLISTTGSTTPKLTGSTTGPTTPKLTSTTGPTSPKLTCTAGPTTCKLTSTLGPTSPKLSSTTGPTFSKLTSTTGPTPPKLSSTTGPTSSKLSSITGPTTPKLTSTTGPTSSKLSSITGPTTPKLTSTTGPTSPKLTSTPGPTTSKLTSNTGPTSPKLTSTPGPTTPKLTSTTGPTPPKLTCTAGPAIRTYGRPILPSPSGPAPSSSPPPPATPTNISKTSSLTNGSTRLASTATATSITPFHTPASPPGRQVPQAPPTSSPGAGRASQSPSLGRRVSQQALLLGKSLKGSGQDQVLLRAQMLILTSAMRPAQASTSSTGSSPSSSSPASAQLHSLTLRAPPPGAVAIPPSLRLKPSTPPPLSRPLAPLFPPLRPRPSPGTMATEGLATPCRHLSVPPPTLYSPVRAIPLRSRHPFPNGHRAPPPPQAVAPPITRAPAGPKSCSLSQSQSQPATSPFDHSSSAARQLQIIALSSGRHAMPGTCVHASVGPPGLPGQSKRTVCGGEGLSLPLNPSLPKTVSSLANPEAPPCQTAALSQRAAPVGEELRGQTIQTEGQDLTMDKHEQKETTDGETARTTTPGIDDSKEEPMETTGEVQGEMMEEVQEEEAEDEAPMDQSENSTGQVLPQNENTSPDTKVKDSSKELKPNTGLSSTLSSDQTEGAAQEGPTPVQQEPNLGPERFASMSGGPLPVPIRPPPVMVGPSLIRPTPVPIGTVYVPAEPVPVPEAKNQRLMDPHRDLQPIAQEDLSENMSTQSDNQSALSSLSSPPSSPFIPPSTEPSPHLHPTDLSLSKGPDNRAAQPLDQSEDEFGSTDQSPCTPWEPRAWPEGRQVLTHLVEGFVIQEGLTPFPVNRSSLLVPDQVTKPQEVNGTNERAAPPPPVSRKRTYTDEEEVEEEVAGNPGDLATTAPLDRPALHCQFCGKRGYAHNFMRSKRFCSTSCARGFNVRLTKRLRALSAGSRPERPPLSRATSVPGKPLLLRLPRDLWSAGRREKDGKEKSVAVEEEEEEEEEEDADDGGEEEDEEEEEEPPVTVTTRNEQRAAPRVRRASAPAVTVTTPTSTFRPTPNQWSVEDVSAFIHTLPGCADVAEAFRLQEIDGQALLLLTEDHLMTSMNIKLGPALKICAHINTLKNQ